MKLSAVLVILLLVLFVFRSLVVNISVNLLDWNDYPYITWTIFQTVGNVVNLQLSDVFNTNAFYPLEGTLLFSDLLAPVALLASFLYLFIKNPVLVFNICFVMVFLLNAAAAYFLWKRFFRGLGLFFCVVVTVFSPYIFLQLNHFQMINIWPFLFGLSIVFSKKLNFVRVTSIGLLATIQFLTSVYLAIFMLTAVCLWFVLSLFYVRDRKNLLALLGVFVVSFFVSVGFFAYKYIQVQKAYEIKRDYGEYVTYSAHVSDYIFTSNYGSVVSEYTPFKVWNKFNNHKIGEHAGFPGFVLVILSILGLFGIKRRLGYLDVRVDTSFNHVYFLLLLIVGFIFSLGPRLNVNGVYAVVPLPYDVFLKTVPFIEPIRAVSRWMFLLFFALAYFAAFGISRFKRFGWFVYVALFIFLLEVIPVNLKTESKSYYPNVYELARLECLKNPEVMLEYPMTQFKKDVNIVSNLTYRTQMQLASVNHGCLLVNGYSGYIPKDYERFEKELFTTVEEGDQVKFWDLLAQRNVGIFKLNKKELYSDRGRVVEKWFLTSETVKVIYNDEHYMLVKIERKNGW